VEDGLIVRTPMTDEEMQQIRGQLRIPKEDKS
jgi:hypothetical protein